MKRAFKYLVGVITLVLLIYIVRSIYLTANISATIPPIKEYEYNGSALQLISKLNSFVARQSQITFKVDDSLGDKSSGYAYETSLTIKDGQDTLLYDLKLLNMDNTGMKTRVQLIGAHDLVRHSGGYGIKADGMKILLERFNINVLAPLKSQDAVFLNSVK